MDTNCAPLVADLILLCHERDVILCLSDNTQADAIEVPDSTSRYLHGILNIVDPPPFLGGWRGGGWGQIKIKVRRYKCGDIEPSKPLFDLSPY